MTHETVVADIEKAPEPRLMEITDVLEAARKADEKAAKDVLSDRYDNLATLDNISRVGHLRYPEYNYGISRIRARDYARLLKADQVYAEDTTYLASKVAELQGSARKEKAEADELLSSINTKYAGKLYLRVSTNEGAQDTVIQALLADDELTVWAAIEGDDEPQLLGKGVAEILINVTSLEWDIVDAVDEYCRAQEI